jgi:hypothetical protein
VTASPTVGAPDPTPAGTIGGFVWQDTNLNGNLDEGEGWIAGQPVELYKVASGAGGTDTEILVGETVSSAGGKFRFSVLPAGEYVAALVEVEGLRPTTEIRAPRTVTAEGASTEIYFGLARVGHRLRLPLVILNR